jgi:hypothetical protein
MDSNLQPLTELELKLVQAAQSRRPSFVARHQHLLGWLTAPLILLAFSPRTGRYHNWLGLAALLLFMHWYRSLSLNTIGKLATALSTGEPTPIQLPKPEPRPLLNRRIFGLFIYLCILPIAGCYVLLVDPIPVASIAFLEKALDMTCSISLVLGGASLLAGLLAYYALPNRGPGEAMMAFGAQLAYWLIVFAMIGGAIWSLQGR